MNYRHAYHAGNFADVLKHGTLAIIIDYMKRKEAPFRVIDTHAGSGRYALDSSEAAKTGEWRGGIGRLLGPDAKPLSSNAALALAPYLAAVRAENATRLSTYPGSPLVALRSMRAQDVLVANELHPEDRANLKAVMGRDRRVRLLGLDGWIALKALLPPKERRGIILIDPPFEEPNEFVRLGDALAEALQRFETGVFLAWYPIKDPKSVTAFHKTLAADTRLELLRIELMIRGANAPDRLNGCGLIVANPPFTLHDSLATVLPELTQRLAEGAGARYRLDRLVERGKVLPSSHPARTRGMRMKPQT